MHIVGGGVIGLCCAWYLRKAGYDVTVVDQTGMQDGCSFGNAGLVVPSHFVPLASPGVVAQGIRWMFRRDSPFYVSPAIDPALWHWMWRFYRSCTKAHSARAIPLLFDFHMLSKSLYRELAVVENFNFDFEENGILMLYRTDKGEHEEDGNASRAINLGMQVEKFSAEQVKGRLPGMSHDVKGGYHYRDDAHLYPGKFVLQIQHALKSMDVRFVTGHAVTGFGTLGDRVTKLHLDNGEVESVEQLILAAGAWTGRLANRLGIKLLMQDGKGYSVTLKNHDQRPAIPVILSEARVAVTPMGSDLRIGGTLEVSRFSPKINKIRVNAIMNAMHTYFPSFPKMDMRNKEVWYGYRPLSTDGLPYIGKTQKYTNVIIATGHAMLGMSLGPATGLLVSEIVQGSTPSLPMQLLSPDRY